jgi:peptide deformylase
LAAPQIGAPWRMVYVDCSDHPRVPNATGPVWMINPTVTAADGHDIGREGCLSLPEITANVARATTITVRYLDLDGALHLMEADDFEARVILHEIDHLDGVLILDRVTSLTLDVFPRKRRS